jgi:hypothetical protein
LRLATALPRPDFHRLDRASFAWRTYRGARLFGVRSPPSRRNSTSIHASQQILPCPEKRSGLFVRRNGLTGPRIAGQARLAVPDGKGAKAAQFHPVSMGKRRCYSIEDRGHDGFDVAITPSRQCGCAAAISAISSDLGKKAPRKRFAERCQTRPTWSTSSASHLSTAVNNARLFGREMAAGSLPASAERFRAEGFQPG